MLISLVGSYVGLLIDKKYIGLLGLLSILFGVKALIKYFQTRRHEEITEDKALVNKNSIFTVSAVTFANGGDNAGVYIPLFATLNNGESC